MIFHEEHGLDRRHLDLRQTLWAGDVCNRLVVYQVVRGPTHAVSTAMIIIEGVINRAALGKGRTGNGRMDGKQRVDGMLFAHTICRIRPLTAATFSVRDLPHEAINPA